MRFPVLPGVALSDVRKLRGDGLWLPERVGAAFASSNPTSVTVTASATPHTLGAWSQLTASAVDATMVSITVFTAVGASAANGNMLLEIGTGPAASEVTRARLNIGGLAAFTVWWVPLGIFAGQRVSARAQAAVASKTVSVHIQYWKHPGLTPYNIGDPELVGFDTAASSATSITAAGSINTESAWVQLTAATAKPWAACLPMPSFDGTNTTWAASNNLFDLAVGAAASEVAFISDIWAQKTTAELVNASDFIPHPCYIPAGNRISARMSISALGQNGRMAVLGIPPVIGTS